VNHKILCSLVLGFAAASAIAQSPCFESRLGSVVGGGDDVVLPATPIGFAFPFGGATYTHLHACTNGFLYLSGGGPNPGGAQCCAGTPANLVATAPMIAPFWTDLNMVTANGAGVYVNNSLATHCTITWHRAIEFGATTEFELQCQLWPNGDIKFSYGPTIALTTTGDALVGMSPGAMAPVPPTTDWTVPGTAGTTNFELFNNTVLPLDLANQSLLLTATPTGYSYVNVPISGCADVSSFGTGCVTVAGSSFYELFATGTLDLSNSTMGLLRSGSGYLAVALPTPFVPPSPTALVVAAGDDSEQTVSLSAPMPFGNNGLTSQLTICSNGFVSVASGNGTAYLPTSAAFLNMPRTVWGAWHDYNPTIAGSGSIKFEELGGIAYITWDGVYDYGGTSSLNANTFQLQFEVATGNVTYVWGTMSNLGNGHLIGFSEGGASADPGSIDISTLLPSTFQAATFDIVALTLASSAAPVFGTSISLNTTFVPVSAPFGAVTVGLVNPNLDLTGIGMPGCTQYTDAMVTLLYLPFGNPSATLVYNVPGNPAFTGVTLLAQSFAYAPADGLTPLGAIASNGLNLVLGQ
jgi:hypothetical protein